MNQAELEATLATTEAALDRTVVGAIGVSARWVAIAASLDKVRGCCRELHSALLQLRCSESASDLEYARSCCREIRVVLLELNRSASIPYRCLDPSCSLLATPRRTCWFNSLDDTLSGPLRLEDGSGRADRPPPFA